MMNKILYLVIWPLGREEKFYVDNLQELFNYIILRSAQYGGPPELIYRKA